MMPRSQCEDAHYQTKLETEQEETSHASTTGHRCFFNDSPATVLLNGVYLCESHAVCNTCLNPLTQDGLMCRCDQDGYAGHEELLWCSEACIQAKHPDPDWDDHEEGE